MHINVICHIRVYCYHDHARGFNVLLHAHIIQYAADLKLSTNKYLMSVAALLQKL